jgi:RNA-directed DNA polymerase
MKTYKNLRPLWLNYDVMMMAYNTAKHRKSYYHTILKYESNLSQNLENLIERIQTGRYIPQPYREFMIHDPKDRLIHAPAFEDRIVHHALIHVVRDLIDKRLISDTYACRTGKGTRKASERLLHFLRSTNGQGYALKIDIRKFFYSINHDRLETLLRKVITCETTINMLKAFYQIPGETTGKGLPLGNVTSQILANLALNPVDQYAKRELKLKHYVRYMDDIIILHTDKEYLRHCLTELKQVMNNEQLETNNRTGISKASKGVTFVGFRHFKTHKIIKPKTLHKIKRVIKRHPELDKITSFLAFTKDSGSYHRIREELTKIAPQHSNKIAVFTTKHRQIRTAV